MNDKKINIENRFDNNDIDTVFDLKGASVVIFNPLSQKDSINKDNQFLYLKYFPNTKYYNLIKKFNYLLGLSYIFFFLYYIIYFIITEKPDTDLIFAKTTSIVMIYWVIYNILGLKLIINKDSIEFKNKILYFKEIRKIDFDREYKFIEIYIKGEFRKNKLDDIYPDITIYFDNKYRTKAVKDFWENYKSNPKEHPNINPDFIVSDIDEAKKRVETARKQNNFLEEKDFWKKI